MDSNPIRVLAVEDNPADLRLLKEQFCEASPTDFEVVEAGTLKDALLLLSSDKFAVVLLDLRLPDSTGWEGIKQILATPSAPPVIVLTGLDDEELGLQALSNNAQDYLVKGKFDSETLVRSIRYAIERDRAEKALRENERQLQLLNETLEQKVQEKTTEVRHLASDLVKAAQRERHRLSRILHDDLQQRIYAIQMQMALLRDGLQPENETGRQEVTDMERQLNEIRKITRDLSIDLSPPILPDEGLSHAINWLAVQMRQQYGLPIELQVQGPFVIPDEDLHLLLFNCVRELLFNVVKHAKASRAVVTLQWLDAGLQVEVCDDGRGFAVNTLAMQGGNHINAEDDLPSSLGLPTIRHQLNLFGGRMEIQSEPGAGTRVILMVPMDKPVG